MDINISRWILEHLLRQPLEDRAIYSLIGILPLPNDGQHLVKLALLRRIYFEIYSGAVSEEILDCIELIEQYDFQNGVPILESMREAYYAVVAHCTTRCFKDNVIDYEKYFDNVMRIWRGRICDMENSQATALLSGKLKHLGKLILKSLSNASVRDDILRGDTLCNALKSLRVFYTEAMGQLSPSFLEIADKRIIATEKEAQVSRLVSQVGNRQASSVDVFSNDSNVNNGKNFEESSDSHSRGDPMGEFDPIFRKMKPPHISSSLQEEPKMGILHNQSSVDTDVMNDSFNKHVEAVQVNAATPSYDLGRETMVGSLENKHLVDVDVAASSFDRSVEGNHAKGDGNQYVVSRVDCTFEAVNDVSESSHEKPSNHRYPLRKCSRIRFASPSKVVESHQLGRKRTWKWNLEEEQALRDAVSKHGQGCWKRIKIECGEVLQSRSIVDIKDKWRNLTKE